MNTATETQPQTDPGLIADRIVTAAKIMDTLDDLIQSPQVSVTNARDPMVLLALYDLGWKLYKVAGDTRHWYAATPGEFAPHQFHTVNWFPHGDQSAAGVNVQKLAEAA